MAEVLRITTPESRIASGDVDARTDEAMVLMGSGGLTYPMNVGVLSKTGHYVQFFINEQSAARIKWPSGYADSDTVPNAKDNPNSTLTIDRAPTRRCAGSIAIYMPNQIQVSHKANYGEAEVGFGVAAGLGALKGMSDMDMSNFTDKLASAGNTALEGAKSGLASLGEEAGFTGAKAAYAIKSGKTTNNRTEMKFEGIDRRAFNFTFTMIPSSAREALHIEHIVTMFRFHSMPEIFAGDALGRTMVAPSTFDIEYHPGEHLHKISTCVLEAVDVKYGGDRTQFYSDNQPSTTELTLTFKELEIITRERVATGY